MNRSSACPLAAAALLALAFAGCDTGSPNRSAVPAADPSAAGVSGLLPVLRDPDPYARARALGALLPTLGPEAVPEVAQALRDPTLDLGAVEYELLVRFWGTHEPEQAARWAVELSPPFHRDALVSVAVPFWVAEDLQAVLVASEKWQEARPLAREAIARALVLGWYQAGHPGLTQYIHDLGGGYARQIALATYLRAAIRKEGSEAVMDWAASLPDEEDAYKLSSFRQLASALGLLDHDAALRWCEAQCDSRFGNNMRSLIAGRWVQKDGPATFAWLATAPEGHEKDFTVRHIFSVWGRDDRNAALSWAEDQSGADGELPGWLEPILPIYARLLAEQAILAKQAPIEALARAQQIDKRNEREFSLMSIAHAWRDVDQAAADAWLERSPLSEESRAKVRDPNWNPRRRSPTEG